MAITPYDRALGLLSARAYSAKNLHRKLVQHGASVSDADRVIARLQGAGLVDDATYAFSYARSKLLGAGASVRRLKQELARKGVSAEVADSAINRVVEDEEVDVHAVIQRVAEKKLAAMGDLEPVVLRRRLYAFLARRGYELHEIQSATQELLLRRP
jgi:regulatory protein